MCCSKAWFGAKGAGTVFATLQSTCTVNSSGSVSETILDVSLRKAPYIYMLSLHN